MEALDADVSAEFDHLVRRLTVASERWKIDWADALAQHQWEHDGREMFRRLPDWDPLLHAPHLQGDLTEGAAGLRRALAYFGAGIDLESILRAGLVHLAATFPKAHPAREYISWELVEEEQHSAMFQWFCDLAGPGLPRHCAIEQHDVVRIGEFGRENPPVFMLYVVLSEMAFDKVQRASLGSLDVHPLVAHIHRIHCVDEARHLSFGRALLRHYLKTATPKLKRRLTYEAPLVARWICDLVMDLPRGLHEDLGATEEEIVLAQSAVRHSEIYRQCLAEQQQLCRSLDLTDPRLDSVWGSQRLADADRGSGHS